MTLDFIESIWIDSEQLLRLHLLNVVIETGHEIWILEAIEGISWYQAEEWYQDSIYGVKLHATQAHRVSPRPG